MNSGDHHAPGQSAGHYSQGFGATNQPVFVPIPSQESCPAFTPAMYSNWRRGIKLWLIAQHGIPATHILARIIDVLPLQCRIEAMNYMDSTETAIHTRSLDPIWTTMGNLYGETDAERSWSWLTAFTDFRRDSQENYKDFWTRFTRCTTKLQALGMPLIDTVIFNKALAALGIPDGQLPVILPALETRPNPNSTDSICQMAIRMYETHKKRIHRKCIRPRITKNKKADMPKRRKANRNSNGPMGMAKFF